MGWFILRWLAGLAASRFDGRHRAGMEAAPPRRVAILAYNVALARVNQWLSTRKGTAAEPWRLLAHLQIILDWVALSVLTTLTGGLESPLLLLYTLHVILAAILLPRRECLAQTTTGILLIAAMAQGWWVFQPAALAHSPLPWSTLREDGQVLYYSSAWPALYLCALLASSVAERLRARERSCWMPQPRGADMRRDGAAARAGQSITETLDLDVVLQRVAEQAARVTQARACRFASSARAASCR